MSARFFARLVNGAFGDPALYVRLEYQSEALLFDCGDLHSLTPKARSQVRTLFVSHAHIDHLIGFDSLLRTLLHRDLRLRLFGPPGLVDCIEKRLGGYSWNLTDGFPLVVEVTEYAEAFGRRAEFRAGRGFLRDELPPLDQREGWFCQTPTFGVRSVPLEHGGIISLAFALEERLQVTIDGDALRRVGLTTGPWLTCFKQLLVTAADPATEVIAPLAAGGEALHRLGALAAEIARIKPGAKLCYVTDVTPSEENLRRIVVLARGADLLAIEAPFLHADLHRALLRNHLTARLAGEVAGWSGVERLLLFHHSPRYQDRPLALWREAEQACRALAGQELNDETGCLSFSLC
jgi:ribonuclease Z